MHILASTLSLDAAHAASDVTRVTESIRSWAVPRAATPVAASPAPTTDTGSGKGGGGEAGIQDAKLAALVAFIEAMTGNKMRIFDGAGLGGADAASTAATAAAASNVAVSVDRVESVREAEATTFAAAGSVQTADGRQVTFAAALAMARTYEATSEVHLRRDPVKAKDPLAINLSGSPVTLSDATFNVDLDGDGQMDPVRYTVPGSGWLVRDANGNGKVDSRSELFGPQIGNGFGELASLDQDGNGWIDEGDAAWSQLAALTAGADGLGSLQSLASLGVGALSTQSVATPFALKAATDNRTLGQVTATGVYLKESGQAGTLQQVDLAV